MPRPYPKEFRGDVVAVARRGGARPLDARASASGPYTRVRLRDHEEP